MPQFIKSAERAPVLFLNLKESSACSELVGACCLGYTSDVSLLVSSTEKAGSFNVPLPQRNSADPDLESALTYTV